MSLTDEQKYWDAFSDLYASVYQKLMQPITLTLINQLQLEKATSVLELGAGSGEGSLEVVRRLSKTQKLTVTDYAPKMVKLLEQNLSSHPNVECRTEDATKLTLPDQAFDRVLAGLTLPVVPDWRSCIAEVGRVLKPGGIAAFSTWGRKGDCNFMLIDEMVNEKLGKGKKSDLKLVDATLETDPQKPPQKGPYAVSANFDEALRVFKKEGFEKISTWTTDVPVFTTDRAGLLQHYLATPMIKEIAEEKSKQEMKEYEKALEQILDEHLEKHKALVFSSLCFVAQK